MNLRNIPSTQARCGGKEIKGEAEGSKQRVLETVQNEWKSSKNHQAVFPFEEPHDILIFALPFKAQFMLFSERSSVACEEVI